jgi:hypothetical protein
MRRALATVLLLFAAAAHASDPMERVGAGTLRWFGLRVYDAELWARGGVANFSVPFRLTLRYARALEGRAIAARSDEEIARLGFGSPAQRAAWRDTMRELFPDVAAGDTLSGDYLPGHGARFYYNDRPLGAIEDAEFARAFFAIWLDPRTSAPELRTALLGLR